VVDPFAWAIDPGYNDTSGNWRQAPESTVTAVLSAMGVEPGTEPRHPDEEPGLLLSVRTDHHLPTVQPGTIRLEDGAELRTEGTLPPDIPLGYHVLAPDGGVERPLIVSPGRCPEAPGSRWGWAAQLYAARSTSSWGIGDLADLGRLTAWGRTLGGEVTLVNPLHAGPPGPHPQPSPYFPSSRCFANPLYLRIEDVPGASGLADIGRLATAGRALNDRRRIDREQVWALKSEALELLFELPGSDEGLDRYRADRGAALDSFATFNALAERHGLPWQAWPEELRHPDGAAVRAFARSAEGARRIRYHAWLQWQLDRQLEATAPAELIADLAVGVDAGGADTWIWQETFATGMRVGAPPDDFNRLGQDWGLPPWDPWRLRAAAYEPFVQTVRAALHHAGGLRVDHVMGLFRLFWIPEGASPADGAYVRYPYWDMLNIVALEADRAGAYVVGEDLGTVEDLVRSELAERRVMSYRLLWFEPDRPSTWPVDALGSVTTHDLPTVAGVWSGEDIQAQRDLGLEPNEEGSQAMQDRLRAWTGLEPSAPTDAVVTGAYELLADAPCRVLTVALDDLAEVAERPNMPGTIDEWPNWSIALPVPLEVLERSPLSAAVAKAMNAGPRKPVPPPASRKPAAGPQ
jgi:4-alpha-glucanotransferase